MNHTLVRTRRVLAALTGAVALMGSAAVLPSPAHASLTQESIFQDDDLLVYAAPDAVANTLDELKRIGVDRLRVSVFWKLVAPASDERTKPDFDASDPGVYPAGAWDRYDTIVRLAAERGIGVLFNLTSPVPHWASGTPAREDIEATFEPDPREFGLFTTAVAKRYDGTYAPSGQGPLPRVEHWSIWNEPNQAGWLTPQWTGDPGAPDDMVEAAPRIYRDLVDAAWSALGVTGHGGDTVLVGETAPKGLDVRGETRSIKPARFIRMLYCLDTRMRPLQGPAAEVRGCPSGADAAQVFAERHPGLFKATGYAHHPYELTFSPARRAKDKEFFTIANTSALQSLLRRIYASYSQPIPGGGRDVPLYYTEFGYQTNPPDRTGVSRARQAQFLNHAEYLTARNRSIRSHAQFLMNDSGPPTELTFQTGLRTVDGKAKPAYSAYRLPLHLPSRRIKRGRSLRVFGLVRGATPGSSTRVDIQVRSRAKRAKWRRVKRVTVGRQRHYLDTRIRVRSSGSVRLIWRDQRNRVVRSRVAPYTVVKPKRRSSR